MVNKEFKGCGKVVEGNEEFGGMNCGDDMGAYDKDIKWKVIGKYKCEECKTSESLH